MVEERFRGWIRDESETEADEQLRLDFGERAGGYHEEPDVVASGSGVTFGNVGGDGHCGPAHLRDESVTFGNREVLRPSIDQFDEVHGPLPHTEVAVALDGRPGRWFAQHRCKSPMRATWAYHHFAAERGCFALGRP